MDLIGSINTISTTCLIMCPDNKGHPTPSPDPRKSNEDDQLMLLIKSGDKDAFDLLVKRHIRSLYDFVFMYLRDHFKTDEITQDVFLSIYKAARSYLPQKKFVVWMYSIARNQCLNVLQKKGIKSQSFHDMAEFTATEGKEHLDDAEAKAKIIHNIITSLSEVDREIVILRYFQDLPFKAIGEVLGLAESHVRTRLARALVKLRENFPDLL